MNKNYVTPTMEVIEIEIEDAVLQNSGSTSLENFSDGGTFGSLD